MILPNWLRQPLQQKSLYYLTWYMFSMALVMLASAIAFRNQDIALSPAVYRILIPLQLLLSVVTLLAAKRFTSVKVGLYLCLVWVSILLLGWFLFESGGHTNPVISLLLIPLAFSAALMGWQSTGVIAATVLLLYTLLTQYYVPLTVHDHHSGHFMQLHLIGMWFTFALSVLLVVSLVLPLAVSGRRQQALISQQREQMLQDEKLVTLATFAASAAHKLGTPLSTLSVLTEDLKEELAERGEWQQEAELMAQQIAVCKNTLHELMNRADKLRNNAREPVQAAELMIQLREQFNLLYPLRTLRVKDNSSRDDQVAADDTLLQALLNLLDNAARVSAADPELEVDVKDEQLRFRIRDYGPGVPEVIKKQIGEPFVTSRGDGLGLGLFLSHATINRLGGTISLISSENGTVMEVKLPLVTVK